MRISMLTIKIKLEPYCFVLFVKGLILLKAVLQPRRATGSCLGLITNNFLFFLTLAYPNFFCYCLLIEGKNGYYAYRFTGSWDADTVASWSSLLYYFVTI